MIVQRGTSDMSRSRDNGTFGADLTAGQKGDKTPPEFFPLSRPGTAGHLVGQITHQMTPPRNIWRWRKPRCEICGCIQGNVTTDCPGRALTIDELGALDSGVMNFFQGRFWYG